MDTQEFKNKINSLIDQKLDSMTNMSVGNHAHNGYDVNQIDPAVGLSGFPVIQVADATVAPTDTPVNGTFRFYVDTTPRYYLWAYLNYQNTSGVLVPAWKKLILS
jgi:hypothetical protein